MSLSSKFPPSLPPSLSPSKGSGSDVSISSQVFDDCSISFFSSVSGNEVSITSSSVGSPKLLCFFDAMELATDCKETSDFLGWVKVG